MARVKIGNVRTPIDYLKQFFAPEGYVSQLYTVSATGELDLILREVYHTMAKSTQKVINIHANLSDGLIGGNWFITLNKRSDDYGYLEAISYSHNGCSPRVCRRSIYEGNWGEWAYENPPKAYGVEYLTTEIWDNRPVYTCIVNTGAMPNATTISYEHKLNVAIPIRCCGQYDYSHTIPGISGDEKTSVSFDKTKVYIYSATNLSAYTTFVQLWYTKP